MYCIVFFQACSSTKFVPEGEYLLASAIVKSDKKVIPTMEMETYIKQKPNFKTFSMFKLPLFIYNLAGKDTTKWINRTLQSAGDAPVIYDSTMLDKTVVDLKRMMTNRGYLDATVTPFVKLHKKRARVTYDIKTGEPYRINSYDIHVNDSVVPQATFPIPSDRTFKRKGKAPLSLNIDTVLYRNTLVQKDGLFDLNNLDLERDRITSIFRRTGYYGFNKEFIGFDADTTLGDHRVDLSLAIYPYAERAQSGQLLELPHRQYIIKSVDLLIDYNPLEDGSISEYVSSSVYEHNGYKIRYGVRGEYIKPEIILNNCYIVPGTLYNDNMTSLTYSALSQLKTLKNVNISYNVVWENDSTKLECLITCVPDKRQGISAELEGTNSAGYLGVGAGLGYLHRNVFKGSELLTLKVRGAYEAITPDFTNFDDNYFEVGGEASITFPRFMFPFVKRDFRRNIHASTQFNSSYTFQRRPGFFTRTVLSSGIKYIWQDRRQSLNRHAFDLIDVSYIHLPKSSLSESFLDRLTPAARKYSFEDHFIVSTGYTFSRSNVASPNRRGQSIYSLRASVEVAGNLLSLAAKLSGAQADSLGSKQIFGTNFAQYARGVIDYSRTYQVDEKNSIAWHVGGGLIYPYGNSKQTPIQKRFFAGGANSVRGWAIRELGPGSYYYMSGGEGDRDNFYYHSGDIRFDASIEYRSKLFWIIELGAFVDAGNIWTVKNYADQPGGLFKLNKFYKEIALAWGLGLRLDFDFVLIRLDGGWKAYNPSDKPGQTKWPITDPLNFKDNFAWHIAVGYPF